MTNTQSRPYNNNSRNFDSRNSNGYNDRNNNNSNNYYNRNSNYNGNYRSNNEYNDYRNPRRIQNKPTGELPFTRDFNPSDLRMIKHTRSITDATDPNIVEKTSVEIPQFPAGGTKWMLVYMVSAFKNEVDTMGWNNGPKLYEKFRMQIEDKSEWDDVVTEDPAARSQAGWQIAVDALLASKFSTSAWDNHVRFLQDFKKPATMSPQQLHTSIKQHNNILNSLPGAPNDGTPRKLTNHQLKQAIYNAQPQQFKSNYINAGKDLRNDTINNLVNYMEDQHKLYPAKPRGRNDYTDNRNNNNNQQDRNRDNNQRNDRQQDNRRSNTEQQPTGDGFFIDEATVKHANKSDPDFMPKDPNYPYDDYDKYINNSYTLHEYFTDHEAEKYENQ